MAKLEDYRQRIHELLTEFALDQPDRADGEIQLLFDSDRDHYQILDIGWEGNDRVYNPILHLDIKNEKIWIQRNMTDIQIAEELVGRGVPREDIILGLQPPYKRPYTRYGVA